jgi:osmotically-inducible protein OsmY
VERNSFLAGVVAGVALAYVMDPVSGRRRRALARDKVVRAGNRTAAAVQGAATDMSNRARGLAAEARSAVRSAPVDDARLVDRVRAELGRVTSHPRSIDVSASGGSITLRGPVLAAEADSIVSAVRRVTGVAEVTDVLDRHMTPDIPALQGASATA